MFPPMSPLNERARAQLENQQLEKAASQHARNNHPVRLLRIKLWQRPASPRLQHNLK
jgi:hypothetical protein